MVSTFDLVKLHSLLEDFYTLTGLRITVFTDKYVEIASFPKEVAPICRFIRTCPEAEAACHACDREACQSAARRRSTYVYQCHAGLTEAVAPVYMGNLVAAYVLFGHLCSYPSLREGQAAVLAACGRYPLDQERLHSLVGDLSLTDRSYILAASHILQSVAAYLCLDRMITLRQQDTITRLDAYLSEHFTEDIDTAFLCEHFQIGKTTLYEMAKQSYGMGIAEYIRTLRMEHAKKLLTDHQELSIGEIAERCGFSDYNYFSTVFRKMTGVSPRKYRVSADSSSVNP